MDSLDPPRPKMEISDRVGAVGWGKYARNNDIGVV